ncbi:MULTISPECIES: DUF6368 family protein [unclassified Streptomyces]|uniref:DUF6368 family protein n=1 Tax=unclassified Streptomyces TaxID=2593676 RepID=UPI0037F261B9
MADPVLVIELPAAPSAAVIQRLRDLLVGASSWFEERRPGFYDINVFADRLGVVGPGNVDTRRPFLVSVVGPGIGDEEIFEGEHEDGPDLEALVGFRPTHAVDVIAGCNDRIDHIATALLTASIMDVMGGVAGVELWDGRMAVVAGLPGVPAMTDDAWPTAFATAEFLRAWTARPGFRLLE